MPCLEEPCNCNIELVPPKITLVIFSPTSTEDTSSLPKTIEHFEPILRIFSPGDWVPEKRETLKQEIEAYFKFM